MRVFTRPDVVTAARGWIGTPYHHQASLPGVGADCLGLIRGVYREITGSEAPAVPSYSRDWDEATGHESMLAAARTHLVERDRGLALPGDVLIFRMRSSGIAKHAAILASNVTMIHAMEGASVTEVPYSAWWSRRLAGVFSFPGIGA
jgi:NlpC/P60 family putative phage cell wall peptidase